MRNVLILGGAGFIGSHLAEAHHSVGDSVVVVDTFRYSYPDNLDALIGSDRFAQQYGDVSNSYWQVPFETSRWDQIYMLAGVVRTQDFTRKSIEAFSTSVVQVQSVLRYMQIRAEMAGRQEVKALFASSSEVYGNPRQIPTPETDVGQVDQLGLRGGYDEGKRGAEALIEGWRRERGIGTAIVRIFNTFGPRMRAGGRLVPSMVRDGLYRGAVSVWGTGETTRTLLYVDDCVQGLMLAMDRQHTQPVNIGGNKELTIQQIAELIADKLQVKVETDPSRQDPIMARRPDISRALDVLGWQPEIDLEAGIEAVVKYWRVADREALMEGLPVRSAA